MNRPPVLTCEHEVVVFLADAYEPALALLSAAVGGGFRSAFRRRAGWGGASSPTSAR